MQLRPYQTKALDALHKHICEKEGNPCVVIPTGGGKSLMIAWIIHRWRQEHPWFRCIILAHRKELIVQNADEFRQFCDDEDGFNLSNDIGIFSAALKRKDYDASILFASIDSVYKRSGEFQPFDAILVDEAHRIPAKGEGKYLTFLKGCQQFNSQLKVIGWTATPFRMGCGPICHKDHLLNEVCYEASVTDLINDGYLCNLRSKVGVTSPDLKGVKRYTRGDYVMSSLSEVVNCSRIVEGAVKEAVSIICSEKRHSIVFFCVDIEHCHAVSRELSRYGIYAPAVTGKTNPQERDRIVKDFKNGRIHVICNVNVYTEGFNATGIDCIVLLRPTLSAGLFSQMVGRGLRLHPNKHDCLVLDFARCMEDHGPIDLLGGKSIVLAVCEKCRESFSRAVGKCPQCGWEIPRRELERLEAVESKRRMHDEEVSKKSILSNEPETHKVNNIILGRHRKEGMPDSLLVRYRCGVRIYREWICLDHDGFAGRNAQAWWRKRFGTQKRSITVNNALEDMFLVQALLEWTKTVTVLQDGKYKKIVDYNQPA